MSTVVQNILYEKITGSSLHTLLSASLESSQLKYEDEFAYWFQNDKLYPLQSRRSPDREAQNLADHWLQKTDNKPMVITLLGVSHVHIIEALLHKLPQASEIILIDPNPQHMKSFVEHCGSHKVFENDNIHLITAETESSLTKTYRRKLCMLNNMCSHIFTLPSIKRFRPEIEIVNEMLSRAIKLEAMDRGTTAAFSAEWLQNSIINLPEMIKAPGAVQLKGQFKEHDVFVVCAGPSLAESLKYIKKHQETALIICVGTALKPLLAAGITPHITIIVDSDPKVSKQFSDLESPPGHLMCSYTIFPGIIQKYHKSLMAFDCAVTHEFSNWLLKAGISHGSLNVGGTVSLSAIDLAKITGSQNIFTFGLDLAYAEDGTSHAQNSMYDNQKKTTGLVEVQGNRHKTVKTTSQFASYIDLMNRYLADNFSGSKGKIYNVNNHGAKINTMILLHPDELEEKLTANSTSINLAEKLEKHHISDSKVEDLINTAVEEINDIKGESQQLLEDFQGNTIPAGIEQFEDKIKNSEVCSHLLDQAMRAWSMEVTNGKHKDPIEMTRSFIKQIHGAADWVSGLLERSQNRLKQQQGV